MSVLSLPAVSAVQAQEEAAPEKLDLNEFPGAMVDKVVVPVPAEIFAVLDKLDDPDWADEIKLPETTRYGADRVRLALVFGATVAEGFIAIQAEDQSSVQKVGQRVLRLAGSLGLDTAVSSHCLAIIDAAEENSWKTVRKELDQTQQTVRSEMEQLRDDDLALLVSLGGWIRGTLALTSLISESYSVDKAELLNQPDLITHFQDSVTSMSSLVKDNPEVTAISSGLEEILAALADGNGDDNPDSIPASTVLRIGEVCSALMDRSYFGRPEAAAADPNL